MTSPQPTPWHHSLLARRTLTACLVVVLTATALGVPGYVVARSVLRAQIDERLRVVARHREQLLAVYSAQQRERVALVASRTRLRVVVDRLVHGEDSDDLRAEATRIIEDARGSTEGFLEIRVLDVNGEVVVVTGRGPPIDEALLAEALDAGKVSPHIGLPDAHEGRWTVPLSAPMRSRAGELLGVAVVLLEADPMVAILTDDSGLEETGRVLVGQRTSGAMRLLFPVDGVGRVPVGDVPLLERATRGNSGFDDSGAVLSAYRPVAYQPQAADRWGLVVRIDAAEAYAPIARLQRTMGLLFAGMLALGLSAAFLLARAQTKPLIQLTRTARSVAEGDLTARSDVRSRDEIGELASTFDHMTAELQQVHDTLEDRVARRTAELQRSNEDLERFAYAASHDLKQPLRIVANCATFLVEDYADRFDGDGRKWIDGIVDGAGRMQNLIDELLLFSRISTQGQPFEPVPLDDVLADAVGNLAVVVEESGASIESNGLPTVVADRRQLERVFLNLIGNAVKYRGDDPPRIVVSAEEGPDEWTISVRDNGIGIEPEYHERVFEVFQRLHAQNEYPGAGIGLASCQRIVERHHGRIWVESALGRGSTFHFTLARNLDIEATV